MTRPSVSTALTPGKPANKPVGVDADVADFVMLFWPTIRRMKSVGPPSAGLRDLLERAGLGPRHMATLVTLALTGPLSVTELSEHLGLRLSTTSTMVGQLSRANLLDRVEDDEDRRRTIVHLPAEYGDELAVLLERAFSPVRATLERLSPQARAHFMEGWRVLAEEAAGGPGVAAGECLS